MRTAQLPQHAHPTTIFDNSVTADQVQSPPAFFRTSFVREPLPGHLWPETYCCLRRNLGNLGGHASAGYPIVGGEHMVKLDEFVTINQAARLLGVSPNTLRNWHRDAKIPVYRNPISGYRLFKKADLEELLRRIEDSGKYPTGWSRPKKAK